MNRKVIIGVLAGVLVALIAVIIYIVKNDPVPQSAKNIAERQCGDGDASKGDKPEQCLELAYELMGRGKEKPDDAAAKAVLKRACDHAYDEACKQLEAFEQNKLFVLEGRCTGAWAPADAQSCLDAGKRHESFGTQQAYKQARDYYDKGCKLGNADACEAPKRLP